MKTDTLLCSAQALRETVLTHAAVVMLVEEAPYETRCSDGTVRGIALRDDGPRPTLHVGLVLDLAHVLDHSIDVITRQIRADLLRRWHQIAPDRELVVHLDVVDLLSV